MMPAAKHGDPQMGVDIHLCVVPPSPSPVPLPTPHMSIVFDPFDYLPKLGATVTVCGMKRAVAGTSAKAVHIPPGFPFAPKIPDTSDEIFMGSATVVADGNPFSFLAVPVLSCQVSGMPSPPRPKQQEKKLMLLPTTVNLAIPTNVFVGGPPTISLMGMAFKFGFAALGKFAKSKMFAALRRKLFGRMKSGFLKCVILRAEPVDTTTGEVILEQEDFELDGRIPLAWVRAYASGNERAGACGRGWETPVDIRLEVYSDGNAGMFRPAVPAALFDALPQGPGWANAVLELWDGARLGNHGDEWRVRTKAGEIYHFPKRLAFGPRDGVTECPVARISDACGNWLNFAREGKQVVRILESAGRSIEVQWDGTLMRRVALRTPEHDVDHVQATYDYGTHGDLVAVRDALEHPYRFAWQEHLMVRHTNRVGLSFHYDYEHAGDGWRVVHTWGDGCLYNYHFVWADAANEVRVTNSLGDVSVLVLDDRGLPISEADPLGGSTTYDYDEVGRVTAFVDQDANRTEYEYDERGNVLKVTRPDGAASVVEFGLDDRPWVLIDEGGAQWVQRWDQRGLPVEQVSPLGRVTRYEHDGHGQLTVMTTPRGGRFGFAYDEFGNLASVRDPLGNQTSLVSDYASRITQKVDPLGRVTSLAYDVAGRLVAVRRPSGAELRFGYDAEGDLIQRVDELGTETRFERFGQGLISKEIQPDGSSVKYVYDTEENLIEIVNQRDERHTLVRDALGRLTQEIDYWGQPTRYWLTPAGNLLRRMDALQIVTEYKTDPLGQITARSLPHPDGSEERFLETYTYDAIGNLLVAENPWIRIERSYDMDGLLIEDTQGDVVLTYAYDEARNLVRKQSRCPLEGAASGHAVTYGYDWADRLVEIGLNGSQVAKLMYNAVDRVTVEQLTSELRRTYTYDSDDNMISQKTATLDRPIVDIEYNYDAARNLVERRDATAGIHRFVYDTRHQIVEYVDRSGVRERYVRDPAGDLLQKLQVGRRVTPGGDSPLDGLYRERNYRGLTYRFDRVGNLVWRGNDHERLALTWDAVGRLTRADTDNVSASYRYDALGRRIEKITGTRRSRFYWDGDMLCGEWTEQTQEPAATAQAREYVTYPETYVPLACVDAGHGANQVRVGFHQTDPNGATTHVLGADGSMWWTGRYDPLGGVEATMLREGFDNPIRLQGQYFDTETRLHYNRYRYYDPDIGTFVSPDPLSYYAGPNLYQLAPNTLGWIDPLGLKKCNINKGTIARLEANLAPGLKNAHMHHIVMEGKFSRWTRESRKYVTSARSILREVKVSLQGDANVAWAENAGHSVVYAKEVADRLTKAKTGGKPAVEAALALIGSELRAGTFPT